MQNQDNLPAVITASAKSQGLVLADVNLVMPTETFGAVLGQFDRITLETVSVNTSDPREVYEPGGKGKGYALGKVPLQAIASALSIQWHPQYTGIVESTARKSRAKAVGMMRKPNGEVVTQTEEKTIDLDVEEDALREKAEKDAEGGRIVRWEDRRPIKEPWKNDVERAEYVEREVKKSIMQKRKFKDELAMTGAKDRVIRSFLALKSTYTEAELSKPLAFPRVTTDTSKLLENPLTRAAAIGMIGQATSSLFGQKLEPEAEKIGSDSVGGEPLRKVEEEGPDEADPFADPAPPAIDPEVEKLQGALIEYIASGYLRENGIKLCQDALDRGETDIIILRDLVQKAKSAYDQRAGGAAS